MQGPSPAAFDSAVSTLKGQRWPVVQPVYGLFLWYPAAIVFMGDMIWPLIGFRAQPIIDWVPWMASGISVAAALVTLMAFNFRTQPRPKWALTATFATASIFALSMLDDLNIQLPQGNPHVAQAIVLSSESGGYKQGGPRLTIEPVGPFKAQTTLDVSWDTYLADKKGKPTCLNIYPGALGWRRAWLWPCTDYDLRRLGLVLR